MPYSTSPITEAEIVRQTLELDAQDERAQRLAAHATLLASPEAIRFIGDLLTSPAIEPGQEDEF